MSDLEGTWKPNGRPQSTIARNFSADLHDAFSIDSDIDSKLAGLTHSVEQKKQAVSSQNQELEALEARLREAEERLKQKQSRSSSPAGRISRQNSSHRRQPLGTTFSGQENDRLQASPTSPLATQPPTGPSATQASETPAPLVRADTYTVPPMPGALPETPGIVPSSDYVMVDHNNGQQQDTRPS